MNALLEWIPIEVDDMPVIINIADQIHPTLPESLEVLQAQVKLYPQGCYKLIFDHRIYGYGLSHPWKLNHTPGIDILLTELPAHPDCLYIHDIAILPEARGHHAAEQYINGMKQHAQKVQLESITLVSVYDTHVLWSRYGFQVVSNPEVEKHLSSYGPAARYMVYSVRE